MIGYRSFINNGVHWKLYQGGIFPMSPPHKTSNIPSTTVRRALVSNRAFFIRWESDFDQKVESNWWHIVKDFAQELEELPRKTRYLIRKAQKKYDASPTDVSCILDQGYLVYVNAYKRYTTHEPIFTESEFCKAILNMPKQTEWWGVFDRSGKQLVAFSENYIENDTCFYVTMWLDPFAMKNSAGYLLFHEMELHYLRDRGFMYVSDGARSLSHETNIHDFLESKFNYRKAYAKLNVLYATWLGIIVTVAYPFRSLISKLPITLFQKAYILLKQEECRFKR